jgi:tyrosine-protein kinase Etk/Wzc
MPTDTSPSQPHESVVAGSAALPAGPAANEAVGVSLLDILIVIAERKQIILWITAAFAAIAIAVSFLLPKRYTATVSLLPPQQNTSISTGLAAQLGSLGGMASLAGGGFSLKNPNDMYVAMLKSRTVEDAMVQRFGLMKEYHSRFPSDGRVDFEHHAAVDGSGKDSLIRVSVWDRDPNRAAEIANGYVNEYRALSEHLAITEASQRRLFFEQQLLEAKDNLAKAEEAMKETEQKTGVIQLDSQARALIESAAALRAQIAAKEVQIQSLGTFATSENSQLIQAQQELDGLRSQLAKLGGSEGGSDTALMMPKGRVPEAGLEYVRRLRDVKYSETIFEILARQFEMAKLDEAKQGALIQVVDAAVPPDKRSFPKRALIVVGATLVGFFVGIFAVLIQAGFERLRADAGTANKITLLRSLLSFRKTRPEHAA